MNWIRLAVMAAVVAALVAAGAAVRSHFINQGQDIVRAEWNAQKLVDQAESLRLQQLAHTEQLQKFRNAERTTYEHTQRQAATASRNVATTAADERLQRDIQTLNERDLSATAADPGAAALARKATVARELLGSCTTADRGLAEATDGLRDQVVGLLDYVHTVCQAPPK
jgi:chromosome condensin MukBEF ATPase and DNA-binding subunit MukB